MNSLSRLHQNPSLKRSWFFPNREHLLASKIVFALGCAMAGLNTVRAEDTPPPADNRVWIDQGGIHAAILNSSQARMLFDSLTVLEVVGDSAVHKSFQFGNGTQSISIRCSVAQQSQCTIDFQDRTKSRADYLPKRELGFEWSVFKLDSLLRVQMDRVLGIRAQPIWDLSPPTLWSAKHLALVSSNSIGAKLQCRRWIPNTAHPEASSPESLECEIGFLGAHLDWLQ